MRGIQINPYHAVAIYDNDTEASLQGHLYSPTSVLPPMQFATGATNKVQSWALVRVSDGAEYAQSAGAWAVFDGGAGAYFHTYDASSLLITPPPDGIYRARLTMASGPPHWSHALCCTKILDSVVLTGTAISLAVDSCSQPDGYDFVLTASGATYVEVYLLGVLQFSATATFELSGLATPTETRVYTIRCYATIEDSNGGGVDIYKDFELTLDSDDACGTAVVAAVGIPAGEHGEELAYLEWSNPNDIQSQKILYQTGYVQRFYGKFWRDAPVPVEESEYIVAENGGRVLRSTIMAEQLILECWPVPDYAFTVLANAGKHKNVSFFNMGGEETEIDIFEFGTAAIGEDDRRKGIFRMQVNRVYVAGCQEDFVEAV